MKIGLQCCFDGNNVTIQMHFTVYKNNLSNT